MSDQLEEKGEGKVELDAAQANHVKDFDLFVLDVADSIRQR